jgi:hypothetical protein
VERNFTFSPISFHGGLEIGRILLGKRAPRGRGQISIRIRGTEGRFISKKAKNILDNISFPAKIQLLFLALKKIRFKRKPFWRIW